MKLSVSKNKGVPIQEGMIGLFFEDINYCADGGLYAEMIENRSFEFVDVSGQKGDYYAEPDYGYAWEALDGGEMRFVVGSPLCRENPHYLRFSASEPGQGFANKAYAGIHLAADADYKISFYARAAHFHGNFLVSVEKDGKVYAEAKCKAVSTDESAWREWKKYELTLSAKESVSGAKFVIRLDEAGDVEFDFISMMPADAVAGVFRKDLFELLKGLHPGFLRFPGGCIIEGNTLENRYRWKESVGAPEKRKSNFNRWSVHNAYLENNWHSKFSHYNQTLGLGYYEYFLLCELIGARPLPVLNVGLACQYQSYELVELDDPAFQEFIQDALDLIEFANGDASTKWGALRTKMGHAAPFGLEMIGIGNEQWQTDKVDFFSRYKAFEEAIHAAYPGMKLIGSAGPDVKTPRYEQAWEYYRKNAKENATFTYAVDEHYYVKPEWLYENVHFYDVYPRDVKVFSGEYAAHPWEGAITPDVNTLEGALSEAAFLTGVERNADVVYLASYAPLFARVGFTQWAPDMIWFDEEKAFGSPSYYVQKMYGENMGTESIPMEGQEKEFEKQKIFANLSFDANQNDVILKAVNASEEEKSLELIFPADWKMAEKMQVETLGGGIEGSAFNSVEEPGKITSKGAEIPFEGSIQLQAGSFVVARIHRM